MKRPKYLEHETKVHKDVCANPGTTLDKICARTGLSYNTASTAVSRLRREGRIHAERIPSKRTLRLYATDPISGERL